MEKDTIQQEILVIANTSLCKRLLQKKDTTNKTRYLSAMEQLEEACWHGILNELLPELIQKPAPGKKNFLWHIRRGEYFLQAVFSEFPVSLEDRYSIDPGYFIPVKLFN